MPDLVALSVKEHNGSRSSRGKERHEELRCRQTRHPQATYLPPWRARGAENVGLDGLPIGNNLAVSTAVLIIASISAAVTAVVVLGVLVWAARKDGEYDRAVQARLGIRRRTRL